MTPYIYHQQQEEADIHRLWLAGTDRAGTFRTAAPFAVTTADPAFWLAANQKVALDKLDAGRGAIQKIAGGIKQLDRDEVIAWQEIREERRERLTASDWTQVSDLPLSEEKKAVWREYRQTLRDLPERYDSPYAVVWPVEPE